MQLALFFTRGISLKLWFETGLFDREKQLYEEHLRRGHLKKIYWLTYGIDDAELADDKANYQAAVDKLSATGGDNLIGRVFWDTP